MTSLLMAKANSKKEKCFPSRNDSAIKMKMAYYLLLEHFIVRLQKEEIDPQRVVQLLPEGVARELESSECLSISQLFQPGSPLYNQVLNWKNLKFLILLSNLLEDEALNIGLRSYCAKYIQHNIANGSQVIVHDGCIVMVPQHHSQAERPKKDITLHPVVR